MEMTLEEFLAENTAQTLGAWEIIGISMTIFAGIVLVSWIVIGLIKNWENVKEIINALKASDDDDDYRR